MRSCWDQAEGRTLFELETRLGGWCCLNWMGGWEVDV